MKTTKSTKDVIINVSNYVKDVHRDGKTINARKLKKLFVQAKSIHHTLPHHWSNDEEARIIMGFIN